jgi:hypothetical protein
MAATLNPVHMAQVFLTNDANRRALIADANRICVLSNRPFTRHGPLSPTEVGWRSLGVLPFDHGCSRT